MTYPQFAHGGLGYGLRQTNPTFHCGTAAQGRYGAGPADTLSTWPAGVAATFTSLDAAPENAGIRVGEVIGWRAWKFDPDCGLLRSWTFDRYVWGPREVFEANAVNRHRGVHAFKTQAQAVVTFHPYNSVGGRSWSIVGRVRLWGEIWEFDKGYHAEFAEIVSLDWPKPERKRTRWYHVRGEMVDPLADLREVYGVSDATAAE